MTTVLLLPLHTQHHFSSVSSSQLLYHHFSLWPSFASGGLWKLSISIAAALYIAKKKCFFSCLVHLNTLGDVQPVLQELLPHGTRKTTGTEQRSSELTDECSVHTQQTHLKMSIIVHTQLLTCLNWTLTGQMFSLVRARLFCHSPHPRGNLSCTD